MILGEHKSPYPHIPFPAVYPLRPPADKCFIMVAVLTSFGDWNKTTRPLLDFLQTFPDPIAVYVVDDTSDVCHFGLCASVCLCGVYVVGEVMRMAV